MTRVIRAEQRGPLRVPAVMCSANERAAEIVAQARAQADALRAQAVQDGERAGRAEFAASLLSLAAERERSLAALAPQAIEIALLAAKRVIAGELATRPERIAEIVSELLVRVRRAQRIRLRIHPEDAALLEPILARLRERAGLAYEPELEASAELARGDCVLESELGSLDARIETQLAAIARALADSR